jgi:hypothetical protein
MIKIDCRKRKVLIRHEYKENFIVGLEFKLKISLKTLNFDFNKIDVYELKFLTFKIKVIAKEYDLNKKIAMATFVSIDKPEHNLLKTSND